MANKSKVATASDPFSKMNEIMSKIAPEGDMIEDSPYAFIDEWISTGWYIVNAALSGSLFGGVPNRRSVVFAGEESTGKTFLALSTCREAQKMGYSVLYFDSEGGIDINFVKNLGLDTSKFRLQPINTIEEFNHIASQLMHTYDEMIEKNETPPKTIIVLDSLGNLSSEKETKDSVEGSDKRDMTKQQQIRKLFRVNGLKFAKHGVPFIVNNHVYACLFGEAQVTMADGTFKYIKDIEKGEEVLSAAGPKEVIDTYEYNIKDPLRLEFDDGYVIKCTKGHKFAVEEENEVKWVKAEDLKEGQEIILL